MWVKHDQHTCNSWCLVPCDRYLCDSLIKHCVTSIIQVRQGQAGAAGHLHSVVTFLWDVKFCENNLSYFFFLFNQQCVRLYEMWSKIKQEEKDEHYQYLKERVSIQHELIRRQDVLFKKRQAQIEQKRWKVCPTLSVEYLKSVENSKNKR